MSNKDIIIIGAGITGLVTAWKLGNEGVNVTLIEKENCIGGLAGTIEWDGWKFDYGAHNFFSRYDDVVEFYKKNLPDKFLNRHADAKLFIFGKLIAFPLIGAQVLFSLSSFKMISASVDFFFTRLRALLFGIKETDRLDEWIIYRFGRVLYNIYFKPYTEAIQKKDPAYLSKDIGQKKIPVLSIRKYIKRELLKHKKNQYHDENVAINMYYVKGGYGELSKYFFDELMKMKNVRILFNEKISSIENANGKIKKIITENEEFDTENANVISTVPLYLLFNLLNVPDDLKKNSDGLEYTKMRFLFLKVKKPVISGNCWIYVESKYPFYRVSETNYDKYELVPEGHSSLTFEFPLNEDDVLWNLSDEELLNLTLPMYNDMFPLKREDIIDYRSAFIDHANPRMLINYDLMLKNIFKYIDKMENLYSIGRQGFFTYINVDGCTKMALEFADAMIKDESLKDLQRKQLFEIHGIEI